MARKASSPKRAVKAEESEARSEVRGKKGKAGHGREARATAEVAAVAKGHRQDACATAEVGAKRRGHGRDARATEETHARVDAPRAAKGKAAEEEMLERAEADLATALDSLNRQMNAAMTALTELAVAHRGRRETVIRTQPLDRATATFQRLISDVVDDKLGEMLPPMIALRNEMARCAAAGGANAENGELCVRGTATLDQVLSMAGVHIYEARTGERFDPLIHLAVGETCREDLADGAVSDVLGTGFRTARGKVIVAARVKVNRR